MYSFWTSLIAQRLCQPICNTNGVWALNSSDRYAVENQDFIISGMMVGGILSKLVMMIIDLHNQFTPYLQLNIRSSNVDLNITHFLEFLANLCYKQEVTIGSDFPFHLD